VTKKKKFYEINTWMDSVPYIEEPKSKKDKILLILISLFNYPYTRLSYKTRVTEGIGTNESKVRSGSSWLG
jgi:hypothetical protein